MAGGPQSSSCFSDLLAYKIHDDDSEAAFGSIYNQ
jgi:hypothetical protein